MTFEQLEHRLRDALTQPLPGASAQIRLAPRPHHPGWRPGHSPEGARVAAGLLLLYPASEETSLVLTVRASGLARHSGQVSFPGGVVDPGETIEQAALREASEEIGVDAGLVRILGRLTLLHIPVSGFTLYPVLAVASLRPAFRPADHEVEEILEVPLAELFDRTRASRERRLRDGREIEVPYFGLGGRQVWGATAMVLAELLWLLGAPPDPWRD